MIRGSIRSFFAVVAATGIVACASSAPTPSPSPNARPSLVVLIVVDQLRPDLLDRYADLYTGGFKRLREEGHAYVNAAHDHAATETAVGHATLGTGVYPNRHGVIANAWMEDSAGNWVVVQNVGDSTVGIAGAPGRPGVSPAHNMHSTLAEWLVAASPASQVASVSGKDRGAVQPVGHVPSASVYWFDSPSQRFVTSTYYRQTDPAWITAFNNGMVRSHAADTLWSLRAPKAALSRSDADTLAFEADGIHTFFPHRYSTEGTPGNFWQWWENTPAVDVATLEMSRAMVRSMGLGRDDAPDFLNISLSVTDRIGHRFGPLSREQLDNLLRLDRELGAFFAFLDSTVGRNRWAVMLTADHGVLDNPEDLVARGEYGHRITADEFATLDSLRARADAMADKPAAARELAASLRKLPLIADAWTHEELEEPAPRDSFRVLQWRSMYPGREPDRFSRQRVEFRFLPGVTALSRGTSHGQTYWYDRHVPMIFMGQGITPGRDASRAATVDYAPTIATLLGIPFPGDLDGRALPGVVRR